MPSLGLLQGARKRNYTREAETWVYWRSTQEMVGMTLICGKKKEPQVTLGGAGAQEVPAKGRASVRL
jgi:hypothetical protein